jgi:hypothetical protein
MRIVSAEIMEIHHQFEMVLPFENIAFPTPCTQVFSGDMTVMSYFRTDLRIEGILTFFALLGSIMVILFFLR